MIISAPIHITQDLLTSLDVSVVCHGSSPVELLEDEPDPLRLAKEKGIFQEIHSDFDLSTFVIINRIMQRRLE